MPDDPTPFASDKNAITIPFPDMLFRITAPHFVAGITVAHNGAVTSAAPICRWMFNKSIAYVRRYCAGRGWGIEHVG